MADIVQFTDSIKKSYIQLPDGSYAERIVVVNADGSAISSSGGGVMGIANIVEDTSPELGGNLNTNGFNIGGESVSITPDAGGNIVLGVNEGDNVLINGITILTSADPITYGSLEIDGPNLVASSRAEISIYAGDTPNDGDTGGKLTISAGGNTGTGSNSGGLGSAIVLDPGLGNSGGHITLQGGDSTDAGNSGDVVFTPGLVNGTNPTGNNGRTIVTNGAFRVSVYATAGDRDFEITDPFTGDICYVENLGLQVHNGTAWLTITAQQSLPG